MVNIHHVWNCLHAFWFCCPSAQPGTKAFLGVSYSPLSQMLVTASADRHVRLYDPRNLGGWPLSEISLPAAAAYVYVQRVCVVVILLLHVIAYYYFKGICVGFCVSYIVLLRYVRCLELVWICAIQKTNLFWLIFSPDAIVVKCSFTSHTGWVVGVSWSPTREHLFLSGSYDTVLKLWDTRRLVDLKPLHPHNQHAPNGM